MKIKRKKIKRKKRDSSSSSTGSKSKFYFGEDAQNAIIEHQHLNKKIEKFLHLSSIRSDDLTIDRYVKQFSKQNDMDYDDALNVIPEDHRNYCTVSDCELIIYKFRQQQQVLYVKKIQPAFDKLVENLIFIHKFLSLHDSYEDLKADCVSFLYQAIPKYNESKGPAFSYFNIIAKNFLIIKSKSRVNKIKRNVSLDDSASLGVQELEAIVEFYTLPSPDDIVAEHQFIFEIYTLIDIIKNKVKNDSEQRCVYAIEDIFKNMNNLELLNKRAVFQYIRDHSGLSAKQLTTTMSSIKKYYKESKRELL